MTHRGRENDEWKGPCRQGRQRSQAPNVPGRGRDLDRRPAFDPPPRLSATSRPPIGRNLDEERVGEAVDLALGWLAQVCGLTTKGVYSMKPRFLAGVVAVIGAGMLAVSAVAAVAPGTYKGSLYLANGNKIANAPATDHLL